MAVREGLVDDVPVDRARLLTIGGLDWVVALLGVWLIGGFYVDIWAHAHGRVDDTFLTPWHAFLYTGAASFGVVLGLVGLAAVRRGARPREALPPAYRVSFLGAVAFVLAGLFDLAWHGIFGFEVDVEALLSPAHLLLASTSVLMLSGPIRSVWGRTARTASWSTQAPAVISLAMIVAVFGAFTQYVHPVVDAWSAAPPAGAIVPPAQVFAMAADGSGQRRITIDERDVRGPALSPDGSTLLFTADRDGVTNIIAMNPDGSNVRQLTTEGRNSGAQWSPDGSLIAFEHADTADSTYDVFVMNADGTGMRLLAGSPAEDWGVAWSPDGRRLAFSSDRGGDLQLYAVQLADGRVDQLTHGPASAANPTWSPDGTTVAFAAWTEGDSEIHTISVAGTGERALTDRPDGASYMPAWSPAGDRIAFTTGRDGDLEVYVMNADGSGERNLSRNPGSDDGWAGPTWSGDGESIFYPVQAAQPAHLLDWVRHSLGEAAILVQAALLAGAALYLLRRGPLPLGALALLVAVPAAMITVINDEYRFIPAALAAGVLAEFVVRAIGYGRSRLRCAVVAFAVPALFFAAYFVAVAVTEGLGWSLHLWLGSIFTAGVIGLLLDELMHSSGPVSEGATRA